MLPDLFRSTLSTLQWTLLALVPPAILALYFLKLKRIPLEVPSTYLWRKSLEDMHVNSLWQRLRKSLLLFLQLLIVLLAILALLRPGWKNKTLEGNRFILMIDNSASMSAADVEGSRFSQAKRRALDMINSLDRGSEAMIITFAGRAQVIQEFTNNMSLLKQRLNAIEPSNERTELREALQLADGLANPIRVAIEEDGKDVEVTKPMPAIVFILSDGRFPKVGGFSLGNSTPRFIPIGTPEAVNFAVTALSTRQDESKKEDRQAFGRILNASGVESSVSAELRQDGTFLDAKEIQLTAGESRAVVFPLANARPGALSLHLGFEGKRDDLAIDNVGYAAIEKGLSGRVLIVSPGNPWLEFALATERAATATIETVLPTLLKKPDYKKAAVGGLYDLIIYDQCGPDEMPRANTVFIGNVPPEKTWQRIATKVVEDPLILDWRRSHPVMANVELGTVAIWRTQILSLPQGATSLIEVSDGPIAAIAPREQFQDIVLGFAIMAQGESGSEVNTTWPLRIGFPVFWLNVVEYLAGRSEETGVVVHRPGDVVEFAAEGAAETLTVVAPGGRKSKVHRGKHDLYQFVETDIPGVYVVRDGDKVVRRFAVNLFDRQESEIRLTLQTTTQDGKEITEITPLDIGFVEVAGKPDWRPTRRELWPWLLGAVLVVLIFEWYVYNRRVYL